LIKIITTLAFLLNFIPSFSQSVTYQKVYGTNSADFFGGANKTTTGEIIIVAQTYSGGYNGLFVKLDSSGNEIWNRVFSAGYGTYPSYVEETSDHGFIITGGMTGSNNDLNYDLFVVKTDSLGNAIWSKKCGGKASSEWGSSVNETPDGGYLITAREYDTSLIMNPYLIKTDNFGSIQWTKIFHGINSYNVNSLINKNTGEITLFCTRENSASAVIEILKIDLFGNVIASKRIQGSSNYLRFNQVKPTLDGGYFLGGLIYAKLDSNFNVVFCKGTNPGFDIYSVESCNNGNYAFVYFNPDPPYGLGLSNVDSAGNILWSHSYYGGVSTQAGLQALFQTTDNGFFIGTCSFNPTFGFPPPRLVFIKTDSLGNTSCMDTTLIYIDTSFNTTITSFPVTASSRDSSWNLSISITTVQTSWSDICNPDVVTSVEKNQLNIFPNPTTGRVTIESNSRIKTVEVYDILGKRSFKLNPNTFITQIDLTNQPPGLYYFLITDPEGIVRKGKVIR
jgi:hypothetical protein